MLDCYKNKQGYLEETEITPSEEEQDNSLVFGYLKHAMTMTYQIYNSPSNETLFNRKM